MVILLGTDQDQKIAFELQESLFIVLTGSVLYEQMPDRNNCHPWTRLRLRIRNQ